MMVLNNVNDFYEMSDEQREMYVTEITQEILNSDNVMLKKMLGIVNRTLKHYKTDFTVHDVINLMENKDDNLVWIVRENGTHLLKLNYDTVDKMKEYTSFYNEILRVHRHDESLKVYLVNVKDNKVKKMKKENIEFTCDNQYNY